MSVVIFNTGMGLEIHKTGCRDLNRGINKFASRNADTFPTVDAAIDAYIDKGDENDPGWTFGEFNIQNCTKKMVSG
tara:strand:- start:932 stop:1159 length:228 start_codon:yes stop_codon:yes gene_type:complete